MRFYMPDSLKTALLRSRRLKFGAYCVLCNRRSHQNIDICTACQFWLTPRVTVSSTCVTYLCVHCGQEEIRNGKGIPLIDGILTENTAFRSYSCHQCRKMHLNKARIIVPYRYEFPLIQIIQRFKYGSKRVFGRVLGELLADHVQQVIAAGCAEDFSFTGDCEHEHAAIVGQAAHIVVPVPMHPNRYRSRGFNQAADIAKWCAASLSLQYCSEAVERIVDTSSLAGLNRSERQLQILGAFRARPVVAGRRVIIVDDVLTTGATTRELSRELYDSGARRVDVWALARTRKSSYSDFLSDTSIRRSASGT